MSDQVIVHYTYVTLLFPTWKKYIVLSWGLQSEGLDFFPVLNDQGCLVLFQTEEEAKTAATELERSLYSEK